MAKDERVIDAVLHRRRRAWRLVLVLLLVVLVPPLGGYVWQGLQQAQAEQAQTSGNEQVNPIANFWRAVRDGRAGSSTAAAGPYGTPVLIQNGGENYRQIRNGPLTTYGAALLGVVLLAIVLFLLLRGRVRIEGGRSGVRVPRFTLADRVLHWFTAISFIVLAITGLILLYGRAVLIPLFGLQGFAATAVGAKWVHNLTGLLFVASLLLLIATFLRGNFPEKGDLKWFLRGGGMLHKHASAGRYNAGEKAWYWTVVVMGLTVSVTGLILDFPLFEQGRGVMQWSGLLHAGAGLIFVAGALGHIYVGTVGMEGSLEAMTTGTVDANWAKGHHDRWYARLAEEGRTGDAEAVREAHETTPGRPTRPVA